MVAMYDWLLISFVCILCLRQLSVYEKIIVKNAVALHQQI